MKKRTGQIDLSAYYRSFASRSGNAEAGEHNNKISDIQRPCEDAHPALEPAAGQRRDHHGRADDEAGRDIEQHALALDGLRAALQQAESASSAKTTFLSNVSHDIRTPMNAIMGMTAIAGKYLDDKDRIQDCLAKITTASNHLLNLINEVLDMAKIESGKPIFWRNIFLSVQCCRNCLI